MVCFSVRDSESPLAPLPDPESSTERRDTVKYFRNTPIPSGLDPAGKAALIRRARPSQEDDSLLMFTKTLKFSDDRKLFTLFLSFVIVTADS